MELRSLRSLAALAHVVPGVRLELSGVNGADVVVDRTSDADLDPCGFRRVVLHASSARGSQVHHAVLDAHLGGAVEDAGGGLCRSVAPDGTAIHWLVVQLPAEVARDALAECPFDDDSTGIEARLTPDEALGTTVVRLVTTADDDSLAPRVAEWAQAACLAAEVDRYLSRIDAS
ncbi:MAG: hypothetical protein AAGA99_03005 [Actinomycetota bacterium]